MKQKDILLKTYLSNGERYADLCILGVENQETVDYRMVIQRMGYGLEVPFRQIRELETEHQQAGDLGTKEYLSKIKKEDRLVPVAILVVYFGKSPWNGAEIFMSF